MIITMTPLRIGLLGGGSDIPGYFTRRFFGHCINTTINKHVYVLVRKRHDDNIYLKYSENEVCNIKDIDSLTHDFIRETLKYFNINYGLEIINWADIPTKGTGLGSSSSFLVGLILALSTLQGEKLTREELAKIACDIEIIKCKKPIGYQDQYAAAFGGLNSFRFFEEDHRSVEQTQLEYNNGRSLANHLMLWYTGITRESKSILSEQSKNYRDSQLVMDNMDVNVGLANKGRQAIVEKRFDEIGFLMHQNWELKKTFSSGMSNTYIDEMYETAQAHGALGGKITGAGGGGFLLLYVPEESKVPVRRSLAKYTENVTNSKEMPFEIDPYGSRVVVNFEQERW